MVDCIERVGKAIFVPTGIRITVIKSIAEKLELSGKDRICFIQGIVDGAETLQMRWNFADADKRENIQQPDLYEFEKKLNTCVAVRCYPRDIHILNIPLRVRSRHHFMKGDMFKWTVWTEDEIVRKASIEYIPKRDRI